MVIENIILKQTNPNTDNKVHLFVTLFAVSAVYKVIQNIL